MSPWIWVQAKPPQPYFSQAEKSGGQEYVIATEYILLRLFNIPTPK